MLPYIYIAYMDSMGKGGEPISGDCFRGMVIIDPIQPWLENPWIKTIDCLETWVNKKGLRLRFITKVGVSLSRTRQFLPEIIKQIGEIHRNLAEVDC